VDGSDPAEAKAPVNFQDAFFLRCPYCNESHLLTTSAAEAQATVDAKLAQVAVLNEEVDVGGGMKVHFVCCAQCRRFFAGRLVLANADRFAHYERMRKYRPSMEKPKPRMRWQACPLQVWMLEVLRAPSWMVRQKAERECAKRGLILDWEAVARQAAEASG
jgi:hypothetical protein